ncbi:MAG: XrtA system polysaccharide deacetylase [Thiohalomonadales bacterium]
MRSSTVINAMTIDVEDYYQVSAFENVVQKKSWSTMESRVQDNTHHILDIFNKHNISATFFVLGCVAKRFPDLVRRIVENGHELASHGYEHIRVTTQKPAEFRQDIIRTKKLLEDNSGVPVIGYRAASYSIGAENLWALDELFDTGHIYSSSIYPIKHDLYGMPSAPRYSFRPRGDGGILEIPVTTIELFGKRIPCGGGGFFRLYPYMFSKWALSTVNIKEKKSGLFYFHPWEIDPEQPRPDGVGIKTRFRHYVNLRRMEGRILCLLRDFQWGRMDKIFLSDVSVPGYSKSVPSISEQGKS